MWMGGLDRAVEDLKGTKDWLLSRKQRIMLDTLQTWGAILAPGFLAWQLLDLKWIAVLPGYQSSNLPLPCKSSSLPARFADFGLAGLYNCVSQFFKINIAGYIYIHILLVMFLWGILTHRDTNTFPTNSFTSFTGILSLKHTFPSIVSETLISVCLRNFISSFLRHCFQFV